MKLFSKIRKWSVDKKRIFAISAALFLTILVIIINFIVNAIWPDNNKKINLSGKNNPITVLQESFSRIFNETKTTLEEGFASASQIIASSTEQITGQNNSTSSSFSTTSNIVE